MTVLLALMLLNAFLTVPVMAIGSVGSDYRGSGESEVGNPGPVVGEGTQKEFGAGEEEPDPERMMSDATDEPTWATEAMDYTEENWEFDSDGEEMPDEPVFQVHEETEPILAGSEEAEQEESLLKKLFVREVSHTEIWKLVVPALGAAAALAALLVLRKKGSKPASGPEGIPSTTIQPRDDM